MDTARGLKVTILTLIACAFLAFALDDTLKGITIIDVLFAVAYIAAIAVAWLVCKEDGSRIGPLPVAAIAVTGFFGAKIWMLINDINVAIYWWDTLSTLPDPGRWNSTLPFMAATCVPLLLITMIKRPSSPKCDNDSDDDSKG
jgi:hypothetical protein